MSRVFKMTARLSRGICDFDNTFICQCQPALVGQLDEGVERMRMFVEPYRIASQNYIIYLFKEGLLHPLLVHSRNYTVVLVVCWSGADIC